MHEPTESSQFIRSMNGTFNLLSRISTVIAGIALVSMTVLFAWLVFGRYVLNDTPTWVEQVSHLLIMVVAFLGAAVGVHQDTHLSVVLFRTKVPPAVRTVFVLVTDLLMAAFGGLMFWYGWQLTQFKWASQIPLIRVPEGLRSLPLTICGVLVFLFSIGHIVHLLRGKDTRKDVIGE